MAGVVVKIPTLDYVSWLSPHVTISVSLVLTVSVYYPVKNFPWTHNFVASDVLVDPLSSDKTDISTETPELIVEQLPVASASVVLQESDII